MKFESLPVGIQKLAVLGALIVFALRYRFSRKFRESVLKSLGEIQSAVPALFK